MDTNLHLYIFIIGALVCMSEIKQFSLHQLTLAIPTSTSRVIHKEFHHLYAVALQQKRRSNPNRIL